MATKWLYRIGAGLIGAGMLAAVPIAAGGATATVKPAVFSHPIRGHMVFNASYKGRATIVVVNNGTSGSASVHNAKGKGKAGLLGTSTFKQLGAAKAPSFSNQQGKYCSKFTGEAILTGKKGAITIKAVSPSEVCSNKDSGSATAIVEHGKAEIVKGTGSAKGMTGTLTFTGKMVTNKSETSGDFSMALKGKVSTK